jgi:hypothetical protein
MGRGMVLLESSLILLGLHTSLLGFFNYIFYPHFATNIFITDDFSA